MSTSLFQPVKNIKVAVPFIRQDGTQPTHELSAEICIRRDFSLERRSDKPKTALVFTHPYSWLGGTMHNNVTSALFKSFRKSAECKADVMLRFDTRGVGKSTGSRSVTGWSEREDVLSICDYLVNDLKIDHIWIIGYSCGSAIAGSCLDEREQICGCISVSYPKGFMAGLLFGSHYPLMASSEKPKLFILGTADQFASISSFQSWFNSSEMKGSDKYLVIVENADHFWFGMEHEIAKVVFRWLVSRMSQASGPAQSNGTPATAEDAAPEAPPAASVDEAAPEESQE